MRRVPLVYATREAVEAGHRLLGEHVVVENEVARAIEAGRVSYGDDPRVIDPQGRYVARIKRCRGRFRPRPRAWLVTELRPLQRETR